MQAKTVANDSLLKKKNLSKIHRPLCPFDYLVDVIDTYSNMGNILHNFYIDKSSRETIASESRKNLFFNRFTVSLRIVETEWLFMISKMIDFYAGEFCAQIGNVY